jgi:hypothetical protein
MSKKKVAAGIAQITGKEKLLEAVVGVFGNEMTIAVRLYCLRQKVIYLQ